MSRIWYLARRTLFAFVSIWVVITIAFAFVTLTGAPGEAAVRYAAALELVGTGADGDVIDEHIDEAAAEYREARDLDEPVLDRYVTWMGNIVTLQWGESYQYGVPVTELIQDRLEITAMYAVPAMGIAGIGGVSLGTYAALSRNRIAARALTGSAYALYGLPNFWIAAVILLSVPLQYRPYVMSYNLDASPVQLENLVLLLVAGSVLGIGLLAGQARYVRSEVLDTEGEAFVRTLRSMGIARHRVGVHVLRVAAIPLTTLFFSTLLGILVLNVIVIEYVFEIPGFGMLTYQAYLDRDLPLIVATTMVIAFVGIAGTLLQDVAYEWLDPRVIVEE